MGEGRSICTIYLLYAVHYIVPGDLAVPIDVDGLHDVQAAVVQLLLTHFSLQVFNICLSVIRAQYSIQHFAMVEVTSTI